MSTAVTEAALLAERQRLADVIEAAKTAKTEIGIIDRLIAIRGGRGEHSNGNERDLVLCPTCDRPCNGNRGLAIHLNSHKKKVSARKKAPVKKAPVRRAAARRQ